MKSLKTWLSLVVAAAAPATAGAQAITRVSVDSSGNEGDHNSSSLAISADGRFVAFEDYSTNLVPGDTNGVEDIFVHDLATGVTERVSVDSTGAQANDYSAQPAISSDGRYVAFLSLASNLVSGDTNATGDIFLRDRVTGSTVRVSVDSSGAQGNDYSAAPSLSADGQVIAFGSYSSNLVAGDTNGYPDVFLHDMATGVTELVSDDSSGAQGNSYTYAYFNGLSDDGQVVVFESLATNLVANDTNGKRDVFVHDRSTGVTERVSVDTSGTQGNQDSENGVLSGDGRVVAFESVATNLVSGDTNSSTDVFVHDRSSGVTERVSVDSSGIEGYSGSYNASISADGTVVGFDSGSTNLVANDTNLQWDAFVHDRNAGKTERVSITDLGVQGDESSGSPELSADGLTVAFGSGATNLVPDDHNDAGDVFVRIPCGTVASWSNYGAGFPGASGVPALTPESNPVLGTTVMLDVVNSSGLYTVALLFLGVQRADIPSVWGGDLLLLPTVTVLLGLPPTGARFGGDLSDRSDLCGLVVDFQAIELDPGAAHGVAFTPGLELLLGR
jgi:WD40 repeat protein